MKRKLLVLCGRGSAAKWGDLADRALYIDLLVDVCNPEPIPSGFLNGIVRDGDLVTGHALHFWGMTEEHLLLQSAANLGAFFGLTPEEVSTRLEVTISSLPKPSVLSLPRERANWFREVWDTIVPKDALFD